MTPLELMTKMGIDPAPKTHEEYVKNWTLVSDLAKTLKDTEMLMRKALFAASFPVPVEGTNNLAMPDGRKLTGVLKIARTIDASQVAVARDEYALVNDRPVPFDDLLKVTYELVTSAYNKVKPAPGEAPSAAYIAISRMITTKPGAPTLEVKG